MKPFNKCIEFGNEDINLPFCFGPSFPEFYLGIPENERGERAKMDSDLCIIDKKHFFVRGCLDVPIAKSQKYFCWLVWVSMGEKSFHRAVDLWEAAERVSEPPYFGWLNTIIPCYPETLNLKTNVHARPVGERPFVELESTTHPFAVDQRNGISLARAQQMANVILREWS